MELEIIYVLKNMYWGNGYCTEAVKAIIENGARIAKSKKYWALQNWKIKDQLKFLKN